jgi:DnaJ family protein A protein 5
VLSDPNERTWYDNNREKLLFNKEDMSKEDLDQFTFGFNIYHYFTTGCFKGNDDAEGGFFAVYRDVFEKIKAEEAKAFSHREDLTEELRKYEGFGDSSTNEDRVLRFYEDWENFSTYKTFVWSEEWDTREANCRWARREMEKENKKVRQGERKTYVKTIKDLLAYVRKRDSRFINYLTRCREEEERKQQEKLEREKEKKREKEDMKVVKQRLEEERFREIEEYYRKQNELSNTSTPTVISHKPARGKPEEEEQGEFYCEICEKEFKSENQLRNHEKSKQHKQMVKDIEREVLLKEEILQKANEEEETQSPDPVEVKEEPSPPKKKKNKKKKNQQQQQQEQQKQEDES